MEVIIHLLGSKEGQEELGKCVATVYAQLIYNYISRLEYAATFFCLYFSLSTVMERFGSMTVTIFLGTFVTSIVQRNLRFCLSMKYHLALFTECDV